MLKVPMLERQKKSIESPGRMLGKKGRDPEELFEPCGHVCGFVDLRELYNAERSL